MSPQRITIAAVQPAVASTSDDHPRMVATAWELATKHRLGKLGEAAEAVGRFDELVVADGFQHVPINHYHCLKAGGYAVQGLGAVFVAGLTGSYSGVMGLPLFETAALLQEAGIPVWAGAGP